MKPTTPAHEMYTPPISKGVLLEQSPSGTLVEQIRREADSFAKSMHAINPELDIDADRAFEGANARIGKNVIESAIMSGNIIDQPVESVNVLALQIGKNIGWMRTAERENPRES